MIEPVEVKKIKRYLKGTLKEKEYDEFMKVCRDMRTSYFRDYKFLGITHDEWNKIFFVELGNVGCDLTLLPAGLDGFLQTTIEKTLSCDGSVVKTVNSFLRKFERTVTPEEKLRQLNAFLAKYKRPLDESFFDRLRCESIEFVTLIKSLGIDKCPYEKCVRVLEGEYDFYFELKPLLMSLDECIALSEYYARLAGCDDLVHKNYSDITVQKIKLFLGKRMEIDQIYATLRDGFEVENREVFDTTLLGFELEDLEGIFKLSPTRRCDRFIMLVKKNCFVEKTRESETSCRLDRVYTCELQVKDEFTELNRDAVDKFFEHFKLYDGLSKEARFSIVCTLIDSLDQEKREEVMHFLKTGCMVSVYTTLVRPYRNMKDKYVMRVDRFLNPMSVTSYLPNFQTLPLNIQDKYKCQIETSLKEERLVFLMRALAGDPSLGMVEFVESEKILKSIKEVYLETLERFSEPKELYMAMPDIENIDEEMQRRVTTLVENGLSKEETERIEVFLKGLELMSEQEVAAIKVLLNKLRKKYISMIQSMADEVAAVKKLLTREFDMFDAQISFRDVFFLSAALGNVRLLYKEVTARSGTAYKNFLFRIAKEIYAENLSISFGDFLRTYITVAYSRLVELEIAKDKGSI